VWFEVHNSVRAAIPGEKEIKAWRRAKKVALIEAVNPGWQDLSLGRRPLNERGEKASACCARNDRWLMVERLMLKLESLNPWRI
jgi:hypothetical protein